MGLSKEALERSFYAASTAAYRAGEVVMKYYGKGVSFDTKGAVSLAGDVVTVADREAQDTIHAVLKDFHPDIGMLSEESDLKDPSRFEKPYFWCVDPLDGTLPFLERVNGFGISIALVSQEGESLMGVCYLPAYREMYHAIKGSGAFKNGVPIEFETESGYGLVTLSLSARDIIPPKNNALIARITDAIQYVNGVERITYQLHSGAVAKGCKLFETAPAMYLGVPRDGEGNSVWDLAAIACIIREAGGHVSDIYGEPLELNRKESTYCHHRGFVISTHKALAETVIRSFK